MFLFNSVDINYLLLLKREQNVISDSSEQIVNKMTPSSDPYCTDFALNYSTNIMTALVSRMSGFSLSKVGRK